MLSIRSSGDLARALTRPLDPPLRRLLLTRRDQLGDADLADVAHLIVVRPTDTLAAVEAEAGFVIGGDESLIEWVQLHECRWLEAVATLTDDYSVALFVPDRVNIDPGILLPLLAHI